MACDFTGGRVEACKESVGGLRNLYIANFNSAMYDALTLGTDDEITALGSAITTYKSLKIIMVISVSLELKTVLNFLFLHQLVLQWET